MKSIKGIVREFGFTERAVRRWVADGTIPATRCGNRSYVDPSWVRSKLERDGTLERRQMEFNCENEVQDA